MEFDRPTTSDIRADARRKFRWNTFLPPLLWLGGVYLALNRLAQPNLPSDTRLLWLALPLLLAIPAFLAWGASEQRLDELERELTSRAAVLTVRLTVFWLFSVVVLDAAFGLPLTIPGPFGLPDDSFGMMEVAMGPLFFSMFAFIREHRRIFHRR